MLIKSLQFYHICVTVSCFIMQSKYKKSVLMLKLMLPSHLSIFVMAIKDAQ